MTPETILLAKSRSIISVIGRDVKLTRSGQEWVGLCPFHKERTPSFSVNEKKGIWTCFGACCASGDVIDYARRAYGLSFQDAVQMLTGDLARGPPHLQPTAIDEKRRAREELRTRQFREAALRIWNEALPAESSPVERYLRSRAITGPLPTSLRYHPELRYRVSDKTWLFLPAMVAEVCNSDGEAIAVHRTFLKRDGSGKADVPKPKLMLGDASGGAVYLGPVGEQVNVTEGIETGLSLQQVNGLTTLAAGSTGGLVALALPPLPLAARVTIGADNDANDAGVNAARTVATRWRDEGRDVRIVKPRNVKDWNDCLRSAMVQRHEQIQGL